MQKMSKSNEDPRLNDQEGGALTALRNRRSKHFAWGTAVLMNGRRYTLNQTIHNVAILIDEDGKAHRVDNPYFLQWRNQ